MGKGMSLVELLIALACSSILVLALYHFNRISAASHHGMRCTWYCMQSLRTATLQLNSDLAQGACLLPQDIKIRVEGNQLFISGIPVTSQHPGVSVSSHAPPPYYSLVISSDARGLILDTTDIDGDGRPDFWADLGMITDTSPCVISHSYARGDSRVAILTDMIPVQGDRAVPAIHYELKPDGLYRNNQLLAEAVILFQPRISGHTLTISMRARYHETTKDMSLSYPIP
ncbi:MAG TPA: prepilin-type N-terminal cleavage/methylation domain-containing protein [Deltaproteobacteria bacterium]|nr:prepilin-type N-terminal cleavage/methylation domain-containing protein [Deltaproteobacteria bacterium]